VAASHRAYGLRIRSSVPLPELPADEGPPDVEIELGHVSHPPPGAADPWLHTTAGEVQLSWREVGSFVARDGRRVVVQPAAGADERSVRLLLLGPVLAVLLHQRGFLVLHASAVNLGDGAVLFLGASGWGKSTLADAFLGRRHRLIADDYVAVALGGRAFVPPGIPRLHLWPDAAAAMGHDLATVSLLRPELEKRARPAHEQFAVKPLPLHRTYVLSQGDAPSITRLSPQEAFLELLRHSYGARTLHAVRTADHFRQCTAVARDVPVARLRVPRSLSALSRVAQLVEEDAT